MSSTKDFDLNPDDRQRLLRLAQRSIEHGLSHPEPLNINTEDYSSQLQSSGASFVTLNRVSSKSKNSIHLMRKPPSGLST